MINSKEIIFALSNILDMADSRLALHQQRVTYIVWKIAKMSNLQEQQFEDLIIASLLHDIGALSIKEKVDLIIGKTRNIDKHTVIGQKLLENVPWLKSSATYIKNHHKKWNEYTTKEKKLSLPSQILYLSDMVEILSNKDKKTLNQADNIISRIKKSTHDHFSPEVVDLFIKATNEEKFWQLLDSKNFHLMLKDNIPLKGILLNLNDVLIVSEFIRSIIDLKSPFTANHSAGVSEAASTIAGLFGYSIETIIGLKIAGNLHDIGKLTTPENLLEKQGRLDDFEYEIVKQHAYQTYNTLNKIKGLEDISNWASMHHERLNGSGYPFGYGANKLSKEARLLAIADFFTSIIEDRPYRKGMERKKAINLLLNQAKVGLLDEGIVAKLIENFNYCYEEVKKAQLNSNEQYSNYFEKAQKYSNIIQLGSSC